MWDNELPSIYYVNALWQLLFGAQYVAHWIAELAIELSTITPSPSSCAVRRIRSWAEATFGFAMLASLPSLRAFDYTEAYALLFIMLALVMLALVAVQRGAAMIGGILIGIASMFWVPACLMLLSMLAYQERPSQMRFVLAFCAAMAGYWAWIVLDVRDPGDRRASEGYGHLRSHPLQSSRIACRTFVITRGRSSIGRS